jgi:hypothetical protein
MSDWNPLDDYRNKCNDMCNSIWKYIDTLSEHINSLPEGQSKQYLEHYKSILSMLAELYFFQAVSLGQIRSMDTGVIRALFKEVFKDRTITLPYEPKEGETLHDIAKSYKENEHNIDWLRKFFEHNSKVGEK